MTYYRVKRKYDGARILNRRKEVERELVWNELYTDTERKRLHIPVCCFDKIELSKRKTHCFFGLRFADEVEVIDV